MALKRAKKFTPLLAHKWERIGRVRSRFRRGSSWLKFAKGHKGHNVVQCTASLGCNFEVLATALETCGLQLQSVKAMEKEVGDFPLSMHTYIHTYIYIYIYSFICSTSTSICLSRSLFSFSSIHFSVHLSIHPSIHLSVFIFLYLCHLSIFSFLYLCLKRKTSIYKYVDTQILHLSAARL